jgi:hypothetical protein
MNVIEIQTPWRGRLTSMMAAPTEGSGRDDRQAIWNGWLDFIKPLVKPNQP